MSIYREIFFGQLIKKLPSSLCYTFLQVSVFTGTFFFVDTGTGTFKKTLILGKRLLLQILIN